MDCSVMMAKMTMVMLGGIIAAKVPDAAIQPSDTDLEYPCLIISGRAIFVNTTEFTVVEPEAAAKPAEPKITVR